ncbi:hypothetical protein H8Z72_22595 (plasmid) [Xanthomonas citri pv. citri]|uniref:hypothetical protein n=1 Tax=Xanthomonas citri TaxID=346 RepID=UPI001931EDDA|nr:hypothetical protein [Xanthomonas citri]QRD62680.1 hypothetical protein H8Z74_23590 [Xanthomonas citri pv. citri]QRD67215.1 hypothetical protein H8Z73_22570 [Xanthomonas citri pv. citri]QRD71740.1 hypothetical protein H8Z72_22595 [Xanthomonas citri pv. citri]
MLYTAALVIAMSAVPQVAIVLNPEAGSSATGVPIGAYDTRLARELAGDLEARGISTAIVGHEAVPAYSRLAILLHHHAIHAEWIKKGYAPEFYGFALGLANANADSRTTVACTRMIGTALRQIGEVPSLYRSFKLPGLGQPLLDTSLGIHFAKGKPELLAYKGAALELEVGIVSHPQDAKRLADPVVVAGVADAIASGVDECFNPTADDDADEPDDDERLEQARPFVDPEMFK